MKDCLLITTAIGLMLGTGAFAQSPNEPQRTNPPPAQSQTNSNQTNSNSSVPSTSSPASSTSSSSAASSPPVQNTQSTAPDTKSSTTTSQSAPSTTGNNEPTRSQAQSNQNPSPSQAQSNGNAATAPSQAQSTGQPNSPNQAQTNDGANINTNANAQQPGNQGNTAQSSSSSLNVSANLNEGQRTRVGESITRLNVAPLNNVNFSLSVGTVVPRDLRFQSLPPEVVEVVPQYRGYNFLVVRDQIVIVEPSTYKIVDVLPRTGRSNAAASAPQKTAFSDRDREVIRKHARVRTEPRTTGSSMTSARVRIGDRLPDSDEVRSFPEEVYRESPALREYRYIERDNRTYVVEPRQRTVIEEIE